MGYAAQESFSNSPPQRPYDPINEGTRPIGEWRASPRWSAVQGNGCIVVDQEATGQGNVDIDDCPSNEGLDDEAPAGGY
jgi:hypothetical protein